MRLCSRDRVPNRIQPSCFGPGTLPVPTRREEAPSLLLRGLIRPHGQLNITHDCFILLKQHEVKQ